jgi:hypothetical protein
MDRPKDNTGSNETNISNAWDSISRHFQNIQAEINLRCHRILQNNSLFHKQSSKLECIKQVRLKGLQVCN